MPTISQDAADTPLSITRGDDVSFTFRIADDTPGTYKDLSTYTPAAQVRESPDATAVLAAFTITDYDNGASDRGIICELDAADTAEFPARAYWDLQLTDPEGKVRTYLSGEVTTARDVTR